MGRQKLQALQYFNDKNKDTPCTSVLTSLLTLRITASAFLPLSTFGYCQILLSVIYPKKMSLKDYNVEPLWIAFQMSIELTYTHILQKRIITKS